MDEEFNPKIVRVCSLADVPLPLFPRLPVTPESPSTRNDSMEDVFSYEITEDAEVVCSQAQHRLPPRNRRQSSGAAKCHGRSRRRFPSSTRQPSSASASSTEGNGENTESLQHGITGLLRLINISVKEGVHGFSDRLDWLITFM